MFHRSSLRHNVAGGLLLDWGIMFQTRASDGGNWFVDGRHPAGWLLLAMLRSVDDLIDDYQQDYLGKETH